MDPEDETEAKRYEKRDVVAEWRVPIHGKLHRIEFEHGTTSGKRVIWVNGSEVLRRDWMFKLVGEDFFTTEDVRCIIRGEFVEDGTDTHFEEDGNHFFLSARVGGNKREGIVHSLTVNGLPVPEAQIAE